MLIRAAQSAWRFRYFIFSSIRTDFRGRVSRSRLGILWIVIHPFFQVAIFAFILSAVMAQKLPGIDSRFSYAIYLMAGFLAWQPFAEIVNRCLTLFIDNANSLKKIAFPRSALPLITIGAGIINNVVFLVAVLAAYLLLGHNPGWTVLWYPVLLALTAGLAAGIGLIGGILNVFMRDVGQMVALLMQLGFWMTPVVYVSDIVPEAYRDWLKLNPMYWLVGAYHDAFAYGRSPDLAVLAALAALALALILAARFLFVRASSDMVDAL